MSSKTAKTILQALTALAVIGSVWFAYLAGLFGSRIERPMIFLRVLQFVGLAMLLAGCTVMHGTVDFIAQPLFEIPLGEYSGIMCFENSTVVKIHGGTWCIVSLPFYAIAVFGITLSLLVWFPFRRRKHGKDD